MGDEERLRAARMKQVMHKEHLLSIEAGRERAEFERVLRWVHTHKHTHRLNSDLISNSFIGMTACNTTLPKHIDINYTIVVNINKSNQIKQTIGSNSTNGMGNKRGYGR